MIEIQLFDLALGYLLLLIPLSIVLVYCRQLFGNILLAALRMTVQLLFVGFYLQVVFKYNSAWLNSLWLLIMLVVADLSIVRGVNLSAKRFLPALFPALLIGTIVPMLFLTALVLRRDNWLDAQYAIPIGGMILGNCLRADIIGIKTFYEGIRKNEKSWVNSLAYGATLNEAARPYMKDALEASLLPNIATMATIGLVSLPGMMTGIIMGNPNPAGAIRYQIMIMLAIFSGTAATVFIAIRLTMRTSFTPYGVLDRTIFKGDNKPAPKKARS